MWRHKNNGIYWDILKECYLSKTNILLQFGDEISALSFSRDSIQILEPRQNYKDLYGVTTAVRYWLLASKHSSSCTFRSDNFKTSVFVTSPHQRTKRAQMWLLAGNILWIARSEFRRSHNEEIILIWTKPRSCGNRLQQSQICVTKPARDWFHEIFLQAIADDSRPF